MLRQRRIGPPAKTGGPITLQYADYFRTTEPKSKVENGVIFTEAILVE
jgi:hypothetical protein